MGASAKGSPPRTTGAVLAKCRNRVDRYIYVHNIYGSRAAHGMATCRIKTARVPGLLAKTVSHTWHSSSRRFTEMKMFSGGGVGGGVGASVAGHGLCMKHLPPAVPGTLLHDCENKLCRRGRLLRHRHCCRRTFAGDQ